MPRPGRRRQPHQESRIPRWRPTACPNRATIRPPLRHRVHGTAERLGVTLRAQPPDRAPDSTHGADPATEVGRARRASPSSRTWGQPAVPVPCAPHRQDRHDPCRCATTATGQSPSQRLPIQRTAMPNLQRLLRLSLVLALTLALHAGGRMAAEMAQAERAGWVAAADALCEDHARPVHHDGNCPLCLLPHGPLPAGAMPPVARLARTRPVRRTRRRTILPPAPRWHRPPACAPPA